MGMLKNAQALEPDWAAPAGVRLRHRGPLSGTRRAIPASLVSLSRLIPSTGVYLELGFHDFMTLYAKRTYILACFSPIIKDSFEGGFSP